MSQNEWRPPGTIPMLLRQISRAKDIHEIEQKEVVMSAYILSPVILLSGLVTSIAGRADSYTLMHALLFFLIMLFCSVAIHIVSRSKLRLSSQNHLTGGLISLTVLLQMFSGVDTLESVNIMFLFIILIVSLMRVDLTLFLYAVLASIGGGILAWMLMIRTEQPSEMFLHTVELILFLVIMIIGLALHRLFNNLLNDYFGRIVEGRKQNHRLQVANHKLSENERALSRLANRDGLTSLPNRDKFMRELGRQCAEATGSFAVVFIDLDNFKKINDTMGHDIGDRYLTEVTRRFSGHLAAGDILGRIGGDEFAMIIRSTSDKVRVQQYIKNLGSIFDSAFFVEKYKLRTSASFGISFFPHDADNTVDLLKAADTALYQVKNSGKKNIRFFNDAMRERMKFERRVDNALAEAISRNELFVVYQPEFDLKSDTLLGFEALVRWQMTENEVVYPDKLIPAAEKTGLIDEIGIWVLRQACVRIKEMKRISQTDYLISVNVSAVQMRNPQFAGWVAAVIHEEQVDPGLIQLEMTESAFIDNLELAASLMDQLKKIGIHLAIDHFGEGYSSLNYLRRLPIDTLKIGGSIIRSINEPDDSRIIGSIVATMHHMAIHVISEGVETESQLSMLKTSSCDGVQGFLLSKPMDAEQVNRFVQERAKP
jgi:diguanylate cyclase (GGDEF) domain